MFKSRNAAILDLCRAYELVDESILENLSASSDELERSVASLLVDQGHASKRDLLENLCFPLLSHFGHTAGKWRSDSGSTELLSGGRGKSVYHERGGQGEKSGSRW